MAPLTVLSLFGVISMAFTLEPKCSEFHFLENLLEKVIRMENKMDKVSSDLQKDIRQVRTELDSKQTTTGIDVASKIEKLRGDIMATRDILNMRQADVSDFQGANPTSTKKVAFSAYKDESQSLKKGDIIAFDHILTNQGDHYNPATGEFIPSRKGLYLFMWHTISDSNFVTCLALNGNCQVHAFASSGTAEVLLSDGNSAILDLNKDDKVTISVRFGNQIQAFRNRRYATFSGYSL